MLGEKMTSPSQKDGEIRYRFSRLVRVWAGIVTLVIAIGATVMSFVLGDWEGVAVVLLAVFGIGGLLAQQMGVGAWLTSRFPHAPLPRLLLSLAALALVAVVSRDTVVIVSVAAVLSLSNLTGFWWDRWRSQR